MKAKHTIHENYTAIGLINLQKLRLSVLGGDYYCYYPFFYHIFVISEGGWGCNIVKSDHFAAPSTQLF